MTTEIQTTDANPIHLSPKVVVSSVGAVISDDATFEEIERAFKSAIWTRKTSPWWIGDLLVFSERKWGEKYAQMAGDTGLDEQTLMDYHWVCKSVQFSLRKENLSWGIHKEVAPLSEEDQGKWLVLASKHGLTTRELRYSIKHGKVLKNADLDRMSGKDSGIKGVTIHSVVQDFEKWQKKELPGGLDDVDELPDQAAEELVDLLEPIVRIYARAQLKFKKRQVEIEGREVPE